MRLGLGPLLCLLACAPDPEVDTRSLSLQALPSCDVSVGRVEVTALGDFAPRTETVATDVVQALTDFPLGTREVAFSARADGRDAWGLAPIRDGALSEGSWLLPAQRSCPLGDPLALALPGAAVAPLPAGGLLVAGGRAVDGVVSTAFVLRAGSPLAEVVSDGLLLRRSEASATMVGSVVLVAGGAADDAGSAQDTFEIFVPEQATFVRERSQKLQGGPRMQHGAAALDADRILLVGGRSEVDGPALADAEQIDLGSGEAVVIEDAAGLAHARIQPQVLVLDDGQVLVLGGSDADGKPVREIERYLPRQARFESLPQRLPARAQAQAVALPGGRALWVACDAIAGAAPSVSPCQAGLLLPDGEGGFSQLELDVDFSALVPRGLQTLRVLGLFDGRVLVTGSDPGAAIDSRALLLDPGRGTLEKREASRVPTALFTLRDGAIAELDTLGISLRREVLGSVFGAPEGNLVDASRRELAPDAASRWKQTAEGLRALQADARIDLAGLRLRDLRMQLAAEGDVAVLFVEAGRPPITISRAGNRVQAGGCKLSATASAALVFERRGRALSVSASGAAPECELDVPGVGLGVALRAAKDSMVSTWTVERL